MKNNFSKNVKVSSYVGFILKKSSFEKIVNGDWLRNFPSFFFQKYEIDFSKFRSLILIKKTNILSSKIMGFEKINPR